MRLMRPGSCVGPQQHYLYENQMTWVRWAAMDAVKAEQRLLSLASATTSADRDAQRLATVTPPLQTPKAPKRPITPPNEEMLARSRQVTPGASIVPRTPGRSVAVPGQPRKTPGKSKHSVASPEVQHALDAEEEEEVEGEEGVTLKDELMLVAAAEENEAEEGEHLPSHSSPARPPPPPQPRLAPPSTNTKRAPTPTSTRPTRIARARQRPLSAIADNRIVDRLGLHTDRTLPSGTSAPSSSSTTAATSTRASTRAVPTRSKAVKDLGTLFESSAPGDAMGVAGAAAAVGGYNLRGGRTSPPQGLQPAAQLQPPASPSKLPQRVPAKRRGGVKEKEVAGQHAPMTFGGAGGGAGRRERSITAGGRRDGGALDEVEKTIKAVGLSRNVRRRSSLGSEDFVQG